MKGLKIHRTDKQQKRRKSRINLCDILILFLKLVLRYLNNETICVQFST